MIRKMFSRNIKVTEEGSAYRVQYLEHNFPAEAAAGSRHVFRVLTKNKGNVPWHKESPNNNQAYLMLFFNGEFASGGRPIPGVVAPGQETVISLPVDLPKTPGAYTLKLDMKVDNVSCLEDPGAEPFAPVMTLYAREKNRTEQMMEIAHSLNPWFFSPTSGIHLSGDRPVYPIFAKSAKGCRIRDVEDREFLDLHMAGGSCLLGYSDERIRSALEQALASSGVISLPHKLEMEVTEVLSTFFPSTGEILFCKTGSEATNLAIRVARAFTGRKTILYSGYAGWHDWCSAGQGFNATGVPPEYGAYICRLPYRDLGTLEESIENHAADLAAIMIEPAATVVDLSDPAHDSDAAYLRAAEKLSKDHDALFIMDEIVTGFRFRNGSAQKAFNLSPDLTCLGKGMSNGMPLAAVVGKKGLLQQTIPRIAYTPTFKGDIFSFAAARECLRIYKQEDVPSIINKFGESLRSGVNDMCIALDLNACLAGPPYRMYFSFLGLETQEQELLSRTLLIQELARNGVISYNGYVLPCTKHDKETLTFSLAAFEKALSIIHKAWRAKSMTQYLDIPDLWP